LIKPKRATKIPAITVYLAEGKIDDQVKSRQERAALIRGSLHRQAAEDPGKSRPKAAVFFYRIALFCSETGSKTRIERKVWQNARFHPDQQLLAVT